MQQRDMHIEKLIIKRGKNPAVKMEGQKRFIRFRSLGDGYSVPDIEKIISGEMVQDQQRRKKADDTSARFGELSSTIKSAEKRMAEIAVLKTHILNYSKTRDVYVAYRKAGYSRAFFEAHREEITLHKAAKQAFADLGVDKDPNDKAVE